LRVNISFSIVFCWINKEHHVCCIIPHGNPHVKICPGMSRLMSNKTCLAELVIDSCAYSTIVFKTGTIEPRNDSWNSSDALMPCDSQTPRERVQLDSDRTDFQMPHGATTDTLSHFWRAMFGLFSGCSAAAPPSKEEMRPCDWDMRGLV
jgi:hypothetical protein